MDAPCSGGNLNGVYLALAAQPVSTRALFSEKVAALSERTGVLVDSDSQHAKVRKNRMRGLDNPNKDDVHARRALGWMSGGPPALNTAELPGLSLRSFQNVAGSWSPE